MHFSFSFLFLTVIQKIEYVNSVGSRDMMTLALAKNLTNHKAWSGLYCLRLDQEVMGLHFLGGIVASL